MKTRLMFAYESGLFEAFSNKLSTRLLHISADLSLAFCTYPGESQSGKSSLTCPNFDDWFVKHRRPLADLHLRKQT